MPNYLRDYSPDQWLRALSTLVWETGVPFLVRDCYSRSLKQFIYTKCSATHVVVGKVLMPDSEGDGHQPT